MAARLTDILCQENAIRQLQNAFASGRAAGSYLFYGVAGVGKKTTARAFAKMLLCSHRQHIADQPPFEDSCGGCPSCRMVDADNHPDFLRVYKELYAFTEQGEDTQAKRDLRLDVIRQFFLERLGVRPTVSAWKVFVIEQADRANVQAQNAMLKAIEEPPADTVVILIADRLERMLPTIQSRCQKIAFGLIDQPTILRQLQQGGASRAESIFWARFADGSLGQALDGAKMKLNDQTLFAAKQPILNSLAGGALPDWMQAAEQLATLAKQVADALKKIAGDSATDAMTSRDAKQLVLKLVISMLADVLRFQSGWRDQLTHEDQLDTIAKWAQQMDSDQMAKRIIALYELMDWIDATVNEKLFFEQLAALARFCPLTRRQVLGY